MTLTIHKTKQSDLENIQILWNTPEVMHFVGFPNGLGITMEKLQGWYDSLTKSSVAEHFSIYKDGIYCGETFYRISDDNTATVDIKILPEARGKSIASFALSQTLDIVLIQKGVGGAFVDPDPNNMDAVALYNRLGFKRVPNTERDMFVTRETFKPNLDYLKSILTFKAIPKSDYKRLWEISEKESWYPYNDTNAPYFDEHKAVSYDTFLEAVESYSSTGIYYHTLLIGIVNYYWRDKRTQWLEIGLCIYDHHFWGKSIGTLALEYMTQTLFDSFSDIDRVGFVTWSGNIGMMRAGDRAGFKKEAVIRGVRYYRNTYYDSIHYGLTRHEWLQFSNAKQCLKIQEAVTKENICEQLLHKNPNHFGIESAIRDYCENVKTCTVFALFDNNAPIGFIALKETSKTSLEIEVMAVDPAYSRKGIGSLLIARAIHYGRVHHYEKLLVKTLSALHPDIHYAHTRKFYEHLGFKMSQTYLDLWGVSNPAQEYILDL